MLHDVSEDKRTEAGLRFLAEASEMLATSLDYEATLASVARLAVPRMADWCAVDILGEDGAVQRHVIVHTDSSKVEIARQIADRYPTDSNAPAGVSNVLRTGQAELYAEISEDRVARAARDPEHLRLLQLLGLRSAMIVPMVAQGRPLGALTFVAGESGRRYDGSDLALVKDLARRAALAIDHARLHSALQMQMQAHVALNAELSQLAEERDQLRRLAEQRVGALEDLNRLKEEFIATASHDLKGPLTSIRGYTQLLLRRTRAAAPDLEQVVSGLAVIEAQTAAMTRLLDHLLDASRIQAGVLELRTAPCELGECLSSVLARLSPQERERIDIDLPDAPLAGEWEKDRIEQVLANLIGNALKYSADTAHVTVAVERRAREVELAVADRGMGVPPEELPRLFERFHRTPQARASGLPGTGLGLYICWGIVVAHGGRIWAESAGSGQGANFHVILPIERPELAPGKHSPTTEAHGRRQRRRGT
jgi:signal transduction histidine kinase